MPTNSDRTRLADVAWIIIHHRNFPKVLRTVKCLISASVMPDRILLLDNSESLEIEASLRQSMPAGVSLISATNKGYAAAVNLGIEECLKRWGKNLFALGVVTHDVEIDSRSVLTLVEALDGSPSIGVVGPRLYYERGIWSAGGRLSRGMRIPYHDRTEVPRGGGRSEWLDGAINLYRWEILEGRRLDENYFLYFEEVDFHCELQQAGYEVVCVPAASARQASSGIPPRLHGRNLVRFLDKHGRPGTRLIAISWQGVKIGLIAVLRGKGASPALEYLAGVRDAKLKTSTVARPGARLQARG